MSDLDLDELKRVVDAATDGEWCVDADQCSYGPPLGVLAYTETGVLVVVDLVGRPHKLRREDANHIATFDPPTVKRLIARVRRAENLVERATGVIAASDSITMERWQAWKDGTHE